MENEIAHELKQMSWSLKEIVAQLKEISAELKKLNNETRDWHEDIYERSVENRTVEYEET
jgi:predicted translin family RNA/ssDNA-binding protein